MGKSLQKWLPLYRVEQVLTNSKYIVRKVGTNHTECVHRIRLGPIEPNFDVKDLEEVDPQQFTPDPMTRNYAEPSLFDKTDILRPLSEQRATNNRDKDAPNIFLCLTCRAAPAARPLIPPWLHQLTLHPQKCKNVQPQ